MAIKVKKSKEELFCMSCNCKPTIVKYEIHFDESGEKIVYLCKKCLEKLWNKAADVLDREDTKELEEMWKI